MGYTRKCNVSHLPESSAIVVMSVSLSAMKFRDKLHIAIQKGYVVKTDSGGIQIPHTSDMRSVFPCMQSSAWRSVYRSMIREGYVYSAKRKEFY